MNKDNHLIYESLVHSRAPMSDEQAAKIIAHKIKGTPNLSIQNIKMYVQRYMDLTGKAPSDVDFIAAMVHDNLQNMGMGENAEDAESADAKKERVQRGWQINKNRWAKWKMENPEAAAKHAAKKAGKSENAEGASKPFQYNAMTHLTQAANHIRHILKDNADDEAQTEHIIRMAQIILGDKKDYSESEYRKMLDGLIVILNRFIIVPMN